jgi:hypothetical protein
VEEILVAGPYIYNLKQTLAPVLDRDKQIAGWLIVFRSITEEMIPEVSKRLT